MSAIKLLEQLGRELMSPTEISIGVVRTTDRKVLVVNGESGTRLPTAMRNKKRIESNVDALSRQVKKYGVSVGRNKWRRESKTGRIPDERYGCVVYTRYGAAIPYNSNRIRPRNGGRWASPEEVYGKSGFRI